MLLSSVQKKCMAEAVLHAHVAWAQGTTVQEQAVLLATGATLHDALAACGFTASEQHACGVWGRVQPLTHPLRDGDRVEIYQPLKVDPKVARRERFAKQGARSAGLFASRRTNSKAGY